MTLSYLVTKKLVWPTNKAALGVCYWLLCTNLGNRILFTLSLNHNFHQEKGVYQQWPMCPLKSKSVSEMHFPAIWRIKFEKFFPWCPTDSANSKETQSLGKTAVEKSAWIKPYHGVALFFKKSLVVFFWIKPVSMKE